MYDNQSISEHFLQPSLVFPLFFSVFVCYRPPFLWIPQLTHHHHHRRRHLHSPLHLKKKRTK